MVRSRQSTPQRNRKDPVSPRRILSRKLSWSSTGSSADDVQKNNDNNKLEPPVLVYHSSARSIVFRDQFRRAASVKLKRSDSVVSDGSAASDYVTAKYEQTSVVVDVSTENNSNTTTATTPTDTIIDTKSPGFQPRIEPLPALELGPDEEFPPLLLESEETAILNHSKWTEAECEVVERLKNQTAVVKTIKNTEWAAFLQHFVHCDDTIRGRSMQHRDRVDVITKFNSFVTSTTILPSNGMKMRCYGSPTQYSTGLVFPLPTNFKNSIEEDEEAKDTETWAWPAGYAAKTEFNVDGRGQLINGRKEALAPISVMRRYNDEYIHSEEYTVACKKTSGLTQIPYNEVYVRVGGAGRIVNNIDVASQQPRYPSYRTGVGLPIALFVRTASYGHLISMMRARARLFHVLGEEHIRGILMLLITPTLGVRVMTEALQGEFWKIASRSLNPFQNSALSYKTIGPNADQAFIQQKMNELIDLDESIREVLTPEELARLAGGFGATDRSVEKLLTEVLENGNRMDRNGKVKKAKLQDVVNEGLSYAVRSGDYHTSRQLLILYTVVAARKADQLVDETETTESSFDNTDEKPFERKLVRSMDLSKDGLAELTKNLSAPPPPPLDTDRLRSATNSDGLLAVLGAAQVLRVMKDGSAKRRTEEVVDSLDEWVEYGQHSMAFRIASWQNQRAAQGDLKIAMENGANFTAFAGKKAITNRKNFAQRLRNAVKATDFSDARFLLAINEIIATMHSPCLRLELLQYVLGLDNRFSVAHVARSVELAAICLNMASSQNE